MCKVQISSFFQTLVAKIILPSIRKKHTFVRIFNLFIFYHQIFKINMKNLLFILCLFFTNAINAQTETGNWQKSSGTFEGFGVDKLYYTLVTDANVREKPNTQAKVLAKLPIGLAVKIIEVTTDSFTLRGVRRPWLKIAFSDNQTANMGYIWGGFLAVAAIQTPNSDAYAEPNTLYLAGVAAYEEKKNQLTAQIRVARNGKELAKAEFVTTGDLSYYPSLEVRYDGLENVKAILMLNFSYPACGYASGNNLVFWLKNNQLQKMLEISSMSDGGVFYSSEDYILPSDKGGISRHILVVSDTAEMEDGEKDFKIKKQDIKITLHKWTGAKLVKLKEMSN